MDATAQALLERAVESQEERWDSLLILADYLEEQGDETAMGWKEIVRDECWPANMNPGNEHNKYWRNRTEWQKQIEPAFYICDKHEISETLFGLLKGSIVGTTYHDYKTGTEALIDLANAYTQHLKEQTHAIVAGSNPA